MKITSNTQFCINNTKLCQELFSNRFYVGYKMVHRFAKDMEVTFSVNPLDNKEVRFTYLDRMVHDAVYTIYHNHLEKNHGINPKFEINYQMIMSVMSGKPQQTNLKFNNARRVVFRDSLLKLASIDIFIDASSLYPDEPQNNYIFYGKLIQLKEITPTAETEASGKGRRTAERFEVSGTMPLYDYAEMVGKKNPQIVYFDAKVLNYPVFNPGKLESGDEKKYPTALPKRSEANYPRKADSDDFDSKFVDFDRYLNNQKRNGKKKTDPRYENTLDRMMIKHYLVHRIMILKNRNYSIEYKNIKEIKLIYQTTIRKRKLNVGLIPELYGNYYKVNRRWKQDELESPAYTIGSYRDDEDESRKILSDVREYTEALLCSWLYHGFITDVSKKAEDNLMTGATINDAGDYLADVIFFELENIEFKKIYCHISETQSEDSFYSLKHNKELCRKYGEGKYLYHISNLRKSKKLNLENYKEYSIRFYTLKEEEKEVIYLCEDNFEYPAKRRNTYNANKL